MIMAEAQDTDYDSFEENLIHCDTRYKISSQNECKKSSCIASHKKKDDEIRTLKLQNYIKDDKIWTLELESRKKDGEIRSLKEELKEYREKDRNVPDKRVQVKKASDWQETLKEAPLSKDEIGELHRDPTLSRDEQKLPQLAIQACDEQNEDSTPQKETSGDSSANEQSDKTSEVDENASYKTMSPKQALQEDTTKQIHRTDGHVTISFTYASRNCSTDKDNSFRKVTSSPTETTSSTTDKFTYASRNCSTDKDNSFRKVTSSPTETTSSTTDKFTYASRNCSTDKDNSFRKVTSSPTETTSSTTDKQETSGDSSANEQSDKTSEVDENTSHKTTSPKQALQEDTTKQIHRTDGHVTISVSSSKEYLNEQAEHEHDKINANKAVELMTSKKHVDRNVKEFTYASRNCSTDKDNSFRKVTSSPTETTSSTTDKFPYASRNCSTDKDNSFRKVTSSPTETTSSTTDKKETSGDSSANEQSDKTSEVDENTSHKTTSPKQALQEDTTKQIHRTDGHVTISLSSSKEYLNEQAEHEHDKINANKAVELMTSKKLVDRNVKEPQKETSGDSSADEQSDETSEVDENTSHKTTSPKQALQEDTTKQIHRTDGHVTISLEDAIKISTEGSAHETVSEDKNTKRFLPFGNFSWNSLEKLQNKVKSFVPSIFVKKPKRQQRADQVFDINLLEVISCRYAPCGPSTLSVMLYMENTNFCAEMVLQKLGHFLSMKEAVMQIGRIVNTKRKSMQDISERIQDFCSSVQNHVFKDSKELQKLEQFLKEKINTIVELVKDLREPIEKSVKDLSEPIEKSVKDFFKTILEKLNDLLEQLGRSPLPAKMVLPNLQHIFMETAMKLMRELINDFGESIHGKLNDMLEHPEMLQCPNILERLVDNNYLKRIRPQECTSESAIKEFKELGCKAGILSYVTKDKSHSVNLVRNEERNEVQLLDLTKDNTFFESIEEDIQSLYVLVLKKEDGKLVIADDWADCSSDVCGNELRKGHDENIQIISRNKRK
ncbi:dentin sialophosphoprotein-like isoform X2 [Xenia sp. Carnegie-2017]|uniref:dentin sialophosphoprotein-like isoform X2 n=1 Tax=Xenia sp. Carnegie-2017 TaxID=2897299 RepID=UPI001F04D0AF|nr:dentin sialophosphoprotein-like isoform X2 [Xenia sp. Carnegie-2017]